MIDAVIPQPQVAGRAGRPDLRQAAEKLEAAFLAEMLKPMQAGQTASALSGGIGEEQFASFLADEHARLIVAAGGIGLAESIFDALVASGQAEAADAGAV